MATVSQSVPMKKGRPGLGETLYAYGFITPAIAAMVVASFLPIAFTVYVSFTDWSLYNNALINGFHFVGFANFKTILDSLQGELLGVVIWTVAFASIATSVNFIVGLFLAFLLNNPNMPERNVYRTVLILPWAVPGAVMTLAWSGILNTDYGPLNLVLGNIHLGPFSPGHIQWLTDPNWARFSVLMVTAWFGYPFMMTACLGALQSIPTELSEAALVDGAGVFTRFWRITFPLLRSATLPLIISTFAYNLNNFGAVYLLTAGGPTPIGSNAGATDILPTYTYTLAYSHYLYGLACAYSIVIFFFIGTLSAAQMKWSRAFEEVDR
ncbi:MAG TPA: sugar ABC transporter permease [Chloroflexota bacterium]|nr:sugar ABC transporter permease [Chloroflexota bacterium]